MGCEEEHRPVLTRLKVPAYCETRPAEHGWERLHPGVLRQDPESLEWLAHTWPAHLQNGWGELKSPFLGITVQDVLLIGWLRALGRLSKDAAGHVRSSARVRLYRFWAEEVAQVLRMDREEVDAEIVLWTLAE